MTSVKRTILIVDDIIEDRDAVITVLRRDPRMRYQFIEATTGEEGLAALSTSVSTIDLVILDYRLPDMNAEDFVERLLNGSAIPSVPIVLLTGSQGTEIDTAILKLGVQDVFVKSEISHKILPRICNNAIERFGLLSRLVESEQNAAQAMWLAKRANRAKSQFLASISHELRTPLAAIVGFAEILQREPNAEDSQRMLGMIASSGDHLTTLLNDLLDIAKVEAGTLEVDPIASDVTRVIDMVCHILQFRAADKALKLQWSVAPEMPTRVVIDPVRLRQILINLIGNAIKYTEEGTIQCLAHYDEPAEMLVVQIVDTGPGVHADVVDVMFAPFTQGPTGNDRRREGIGLGLAISRHLAVLMGGRLELEKTSEQGTTFILEIKAPRIADHDAIPSTTNAPRSPEMGINACHGKRVLVAEDVRANRYLLERILTRLGAAAEFAENGKQAIERIESASRNQLTYDLVIMDMQMPVMDGYEATSLIKTTHPSLPIIALTAAALRDDRQRCLDAGCDDILLKPIDFRKFEQTLRHYCTLASRPH